MNKEKHRTTKYVKTRRELRINVNNPQFCHFTEIDENFFEVEKLKHNINLNLPNYLGFFVLNYAKLHMLQFYYDVLCKSIPRHLFEPLEMDTDSFYGFYAGNSLEELMTETGRKEFRKKVYENCNENAVVDASTDNWFPRECCDKHRQYDRRTPGLFKLEASGNYMTCLTSKTYLLRDDEQNDIKFSSKGVQKQRLLSMHGGKDGVLGLFKDVLRTKQPHEVLNVGFRARQSTMQTYRQRKT